MPHTLVLAGLTCGLGVWGFFKIMTAFMPYDDEGMLIYALKNFFDGNILYDELTTQYGPGFFLINGWIMNIFRLMPTHDHTRLLSLAYWLIGSLLLAISVFRLNRNILTSAITLLISFIISSVIINEPGHPQALMYALISLFVLGITFSPKTMVFFLLGIISGLCIMVKINIGIYMVLATGWTILRFLPPNILVKSILIFLGLCLMALPAVLMYSKLSNPTYLLYMLISTIGIMNLIIVSLRQLKNRLPFTAGFWFLGGLVLACAGILISSLKNGMSLSGLYEGLINQHISFSQTFWFEPPIDLKMAFNALISFAFCIFLSYVYYNDRYKNYFSEKSLKFLGASFACIKTLFLLSIIALTVIIPEFRQPILIIFYSWSWIFLFLGKGHKCSHSEFFIKYFLLSLATLLFLIAFPVAGSQMSWSTILLVPIIALLLFYCMRWLIAYIEDAGNYKVPEKLASAILVVFIFFFVTWQIQRNEHRYHNNQASSILKGSSLLRLPDASRTVNEQLVLYIRENAKYLLTLPGMYSFNVWSGIETPTLKNQTNWPFAFDEAKQREIVDKVSALEKVLILYGKNGMMFWNKQGKTQPSLIVSYMRDHFVVVKAIGGFDILAKASEIEKINR